MGFVGTLHFSLSANYDFTKEYHLYKGTNNTHTLYRFQSCSTNTVNSIRIYFHQQRYKVFYKVYIDIKFVLQFVRNDNYTVIYGVYHMYTKNWIIKENNAYFVGLTKGNTTDGKSDPLKSKACKTWITVGMNQLCLIFHLLSYFFSFQKSSILPPMIIDYDD